MAELDDDIVAGLDGVDDGLEAALIGVGASGTAAAGPVHDLGVLDRVLKVLTPTLKAC